MSLLVVVLPAFQVVVKFRPAVNAAREMFSIPLRFGEDLSFVALAFVLPLALFTVAFSLSILSEKSHVAVFLSALVSYLIFIGLIHGTALLELMSFRAWAQSGLGTVRILGVFILLSFAGASAKNF